MPLTPQLTTWWRQASWQDRGGRSRWQRTTRRTWSPRPAARGRSPLVACPPLPRGRLTPIKERSWLVPPLATTGDSTSWRGAASPSRPCCRTNSSAPPPQCPWSTPRLCWDRQRAWWWHVRHALWVQFLDEGFHSSTKGVQWILYAVLFQQPPHAITIGCSSHIHRIFGQCIHGSEIACQPMSVGEIKPIAPGLEKGLTRFSTKSERHIIALRITPSHRKGNAEREQDEQP